MQRNQVAKQVSSSSGTEKWIGLSTSFNEYGDFERPRVCRRRVDRRPSSAHWCAKPWVIGFEHFTIVGDWNTDAGTLRFDQASSSALQSYYIFVLSGCLCLGNARRQAST